MRKKYVNFCGREVPKDDFERTRFDRNLLFGISNPFSFLADGLYFDGNEVYDFIKKNPDKYLSSKKTHNGLDEICNFKDLIKDMIDERYSEMESYLKRECVFEDISGSLHVISGRFSINISFVDPLYDVYVESHEIENLRFTILKNVTLEAAENKIKEFKTQLREYYEILEFRNKQ